MYVLNFLNLAVLTAVVVAADVTRPRGVSITKNTFYNPEIDFTCLDGSLVIPFRYVNDDFCDCIDGSDEPGTPACPNGIFHCTNAGHKPYNIPSSRVNDGICDCCDASDEYNSSVQCINNCKELGRKAREDAIRQAEVGSQGYQIRLELAQQGKQKKLELQQHLETITKQKEDAENIKNEKQTVKSAAEELEKAALDKHKSEEEQRKELEEQTKQDEKDKLDAIDAFNDLDANQDRKVTLDEIQAKWVFDTDKDGIVTDEEAKFYLGGKDEYTEETFVSLGWLLVKPHYSMLKLFTPPEPEEVGIEQSEQVDEKKDDDQPSEVEEDDRKDEETDDEDEDGNAEYDPEAQKEDEELASIYDDETQKLIDDAKAARSEFDEANKLAMDLDRQIKDTQSILVIDFGEDDQFAPLHSQCYEYTDREYVYKMCLFDAVTQRPKSGGSEVTLGRWGVWTGGEDNKYSKMKFENGLSCWNGPTRATEVILSCGLENRILTVSEPNRCIYMMEFETPAVCVSLVGDKAEHMHEEL
ncbi:hypothetical protein CHUAL_011625 [Chamberlinius hualienensis]